MYRIGQLFHLTHVVSDLEAVDRWYDRIFSVKRFYTGYMEEAGRNASLVAIGDTVMEPMMPAQGSNLRNPSVKKFHDRFAQHFHSIAWYVDDVPAISARLREHGLRQFDILGRQVRPDKPPLAFWTHPKETFGQLEFAVAGNQTHDPRLKPGWSSEFWRSEHPLHIERASHITVVVGDLARAGRFYCEIVGGRLLHEEHASTRNSAFVAVGADTVVELAQPTSADSAEGRELEKNGEGIFSLTFKCRDVGTANEFLKSKDLHPESDGGDLIALDKDQAFGMVIRFTQRSIPNDPR